MNGRYTRKSAIMYDTKWAIGKQRGSLLRSIARNTATLVDNKTLEQDVKTSERNELSRNTISEYLDALSRLMILYEQPAFNPHIRSSASLRKSLNIITGTGMTYRRPDGINVISLASLGK